MDKVKAKLSSLHKSFTNWFNVTGLLIFQVLLSYPEFIDYLKVNELFYIVIIVNVYLRVFKTDRAIEAK